MKTNTQYRYCRLLLGEAPLPGHSSESLVCSGGIRPYDTDVFPGGSLNFAMVAASAADTAELSRPAGCCWLPSALPQPQPSQPIARESSSACGCLQLTSVQPRHQAAHEQSRHLMAPLPLYRCLLLLHRCADTGCRSDLQGHGQFSRWLHYLLCAAETLAGTTTTSVHLQTTHFAKACPAEVLRADCVCGQYHLVCTAAVRAARLPMPVLSRQPPPLRTSILTT